VGGSIRYPSAFNGVAGHKPTGTMVPSTLHWPPAHGPIARYCCYGPIARRVEDLFLILSLIAGPDGKDPVVEKRDLKSPDNVDTSKLKAFYFDYNGEARTDADVRRAVAMAAGAIADRKIPIEYWRPEGMEHSLEIWQAGMSENPEPFIDFISGEERISLGKEFLRLLVGKSKITFPALGATLIEEKFFNLFKSLNRKYLAMAAPLRQQIEEKLGDNGVLLCPVFSTPAPKHTYIWLNFLGIGYSGVMNIMEFPATIVPIYHRQDGLPVSIQIVSGRWKDHLTMATAKLLEETFGGWKPPEKIG